MANQLLDEARDCLLNARDELAILKTDGLKSVIAQRKLTREFSRGVINTLTQLRTALERCAAAIYHECIPMKPRTERKYQFPIAKTGSSPADFAVQLDKFFPRIRQHRSDIADLLESYQEFKDPGQKWLSNFDLLCSKNKHKKNDPSLAVALNNIVVNGAVAFVGCVNGEVQNLSVGDGFVGQLSIDGKGNVASFWGSPGTRVKQGVRVIVRFDAIQEEVIPFLKRSLEGIGHIVEGVSKKI